MGNVQYYKEKLLPGVSINVSCAEELLCQAFIKNVYHENDLSKLKEVFKERPDCLKLISSYTGTFTYFLYLKKIMCIINCWLD